MNVETAVREFLKNELGKDVTGVRADDSLLESGTIDSMGVLQLVAFLEARYDLKVEDDDLTPDNFDTLTAIASFIRQRQAGPRD